jgi:hypothetical protein
MGLALAVAGAGSGCSLLPGVPTPAPVPVEQQPVGVAVPVPPDRMRLEMNNGTTIVVVLSVNGGVGRELAPGSVADLGVTELGPLPWRAKVSTIHARRLLDLTVNAGDVTATNQGGGSTSARGAGARVDLSCGRIDLWSGMQPLGPAPGPGTPGDCDP